MHRCYQINFDSYVCSRRLITEYVGSRFTHTMGLWSSPLSRYINDTSCLSNYDLLNFLIYIYVGRFSTIWNLFFHLSYEGMGVLFRLYVCVDECIKWVRHSIFFFICEHLCSSKFCSVHRNRANLLSDLQLLIIKQHKVQQIFFNRYQFK